MIKLKIKYAIFDMDGLMFDTETLFVRSFQEYVSPKTGMCFSKENLCRLSGMNINDMQETFKRFFGTKYTCEECFELSHKWIDEYIEKNGLEVKKGLYEILEFLKVNGVRMAVASGSSSTKVLRFIKIAKVEKYFDAVICGNMIEHCKPSPDIFELAAEKLGCVNTREAVVFEDSENGLIAACRGNFNSVIIPDLVDPTINHQGEYTIKEESLDKAIPHFEF